jgi:hypothetical protein
MTIFDRFNISSDPDHREDTPNNRPHGSNSFETTKLSL